MSEAMCVSVRTHSFKGTPLAGATVGEGLAHPQDSAHDERDDQYADADHGFYVGVAPCEAGGLRLRRCS